MEEQSSPDFIIIDDDRINNIICSKILQVTFPKRNVRAFNDPEKGLEYIRSTYEKDGVNDAILFLDINMPVLNGWDVLEEYKDFPEPVKRHFKIYMLSSSVDTKDKQKADDNPLVTAYIEKPLTQTIILKLVS